MISTTYHLTSADELSPEIFDAIKATFKSKAITITVEEDENENEISEEKKAILDERLMEDESTYLTSKDSINLLNKKYGL